MILFRYANEIHCYLRKIAGNGRTIGFVPTMGALHNGHISLINESRQSNSLTVSSIFVNPTQFNNPEDFTKYPVTIENDIYLLEKNGCDVLFLPSVEEIYPEGDNQDKWYDLGYLETILEGKFRPGHFQGVCKVVERLLDIITPTSLYAGQKDYQQCMVLKRLLELMGSRINLKIVPTERESDGLAMSSRNLRLDEKERKVAVEIFKTLLFIKENFQSHDLASISKAAISRLKEKDFLVDYVEIADAETLNPIETNNPNEPLVALIAASLDDVRLIDNLRLTN